MKLDTQINQTSTNISGQKIESSVSADGFVFDLMASAIYKNKPYAIVRELVANGTDSHRKAGKAEVPVKVVLPTVLDPELIIQDFGLGMDEDEIRDNFLRIGGSTKRESIHDIGGFGVGCKAPYSYTDNLILETKKGGVHTIFSISKSEDGKPEATAVSVTECDLDDTGVMIRIPINPSDTEAFRRALDRTYSYMDIKPDIYPKSLCENFKDKRFESRHKFMKATYERGCRGVVAGGIFYDVPQDMYEEFDQHLFESLPKIYVKAEIDDVTPSVDRESLQIVPKNITFLKKEMEAAEKTLLAKAQKLLDKIVDFESTREVIEVLQYDSVLHEFILKHPDTQSMVIDGKEWKLYTILSGYFSIKKIHARRYRELRSRNLYGRRSLPIQQPLRILVKDEGRNISKCETEFDYYVLPDDVEDCNAHLLDVHPFFKDFQFTYLSELNKQKYFEKKKDYKPRVYSGPKNYRFYVTDVQGTHEISCKATHLKKHVEKYKKFYILRDSSIPELDRLFRVEPSLAIIHYENEKFAKTRSFEDLLYSSSCLGQSSSLRSRVKRLYRKDLIDQSRKLSWEMAKRKILSNTTHYMLGLLDKEVEALDNIEPREEINWVDLDDKTQSKIFRVMTQKAQNIHMKALSRPETRLLDFIDPSKINSEADRDYLKRALNLGEKR